MSNEYSGEERRKTERDHDVLTRIDANLSNFMKRFEDHTQEDKNGFGRLDDRTARLERFMWGAIGIIAFVEFLSKILKW